MCDIFWCGHGLESHSQSFLLTYPEDDLAYGVLSSIFKCMILQRYSVVKFILMNEDVVCVLVVLQKGAEYEMKTKLYI